MAKRRRDTDAELDRETAWAAVTIMAGLYPEARRPAALRGLLDAMEQEFRASGIPAPAWLEELRARLGSHP